MNPYFATSPVGRYEDAHLSIDFQSQIVKVDGAAIKMPTKEFQLLSCLVLRHGELVSREKLLATIWGYGGGVRTRTLDVHIRRLRKDLGPYGKLYIETVFGVGYRFQPGPAPKGDTVETNLPLRVQAGSGAWRLCSSTQ